MIFRSVRALFGQGLWGRRYQLLMLLSVLLSFEFALHAINFPNIEEINPLYVPHARYHHLHIPNNVYVDLPRSGDSYKKTKMRFNSLGFRGPELDFQDPTAKVLLIGDSYVEGAQAMDYEIFSNLTQSAFKALEVINISCSSWSSIIYYNWLKENAHRINNLKHVYLFYVYNDLENSLSYLRDADDPSDFENPIFENMADRVRMQNESRVMKVKSYLRDKSRVYLVLARFKHLIQQYYLNVTHPEREINRFLDSYRKIFGDADVKWKKRAVDIESKYLGLIANLLTIKQIGFTVVYIPIAPQVSKDENRVGSGFLDATLSDTIYRSTFFQSMLQKIAFDHDFSFIDFTTLFRDYKYKYPTRLLYNHIDGHFSIAGHKAASEILIKIIGDNAQKYGWRNRKIRVGANARTH